MVTLGQSLPVLFIGHGSPDILLRRDPLLEEWERQVAGLPRPRRILVVSAHWESDRFSVSGNGRRETLYDFSGFPRALYRCQYRPPADEAGAVELSRALDCRLDSERGLDHGAWVPLSVLYPQQDIPVMLMSVAPSLGAEAHWAMGERLAGLRNEGVLIVASGVVVHNLSRLGADCLSQRPPSWARAFMDAVGQAVMEGDAGSLQGYSRLPGAAESVPTPEHFLPLLVACAAAGGDAPRMFAEAWRFDSLSQHSFRWGD